MVPKKNSLGWLQGYIENLCNIFYNLKDKIEKFLKEEKRKKEKRVHEDYEYGSPSASGLLAKKKKSV